MRRLLLLLATPTLLAAADHSLRINAGPYEIYTDAGERAARATAVRFEEFRHAVAEVTGDADPRAPLPIRIFVFNRPTGWEVAPLSQGRSSYNIVLNEKSQIAPATYGLLAELFLTHAGSRLPAHFEHGLVEFFSTYSVNGIHITVGAPPSSPDADWALIHLLVTDPQYFGKLRVLVFNLRKNAAEDPAYRNAFGKSAADFTAAARAHLAAGHFETTSISSLPMAQKDFAIREVSETDARLARADLLAGAQSRAEYEALLKADAKTAESEEGLGLLDLRESHPDSAKTHFAAAMQAGTTSTRCYIEFAKLEPDYALASQALLKAAGIDAKSAEPLALLATRDTDPQRRLAHWKAAAEREPRNAVYWEKLAEAYRAAGDYANAAKAYTSAAGAAPDTATRDRYVQARISIEQQRLDADDAEKRREADEEAASVAKLKAEEMAKIHALENKYKTATDPNNKPLPYHIGPDPPAHVAGALTQVDCLPAGQARLNITTAEKKVVKLLIAKPDAVSIEGPSGVTLACGAQNRRVSVGYFPKANAKLGTSGEAAIIEFQ
jgi:hypothetical protein